MATYSEITKQLESAQAGKSFISRQLRYAVSKMAFGLSFILGPWTQILIMLYAPFQSFKAVISEGTDDDKQWLTFWSVYMAFATLEEFGLRYVISYFTFFGQSFYYEIKAAFVVYLMFFNGAVEIFDLFVQPFMKKYQKRMDDAIAKVANMADEVKDQALKDPESFISLYGKEAYQVAAKQAALMKEKMK